MSSEKETKPIANTALGWIVALAIGVAEFLIGFLTTNLPIGRWWTVNGWFIGYIWIFMFVSFIAKLTPKFRFNSAQLAAIIVPAYLAAGKNWIASNTGECKFFGAVQSSDSFVLCLSGEWVVVDISVLEMVVEFSVGVSDEYYGEQVP